MKEIIQTVEIKKYMADDGAIFLNINQCEDHESELLQNKLEEEAIRKLGIETIDSNFPSMVDLRNKPKYNLFYIENKEDLDLFCKAYEDYWFGKNAWQLNRDTFNYPEVLCILDFEQGSEQYRLYRMSQLFNQFDAFSIELSKVIEEKSKIKNNNIQTEK